MADKMLIDASHEEETRVVVVRGNRIEEFDFESQHKKQLRGNIYLAKVTRVEPSLQAAFVDYGGNRHGFLAFSEIHPDYYQIPLADRQALLAAEAEAEAERARRENEDDESQEAASGPADDDEPEAEEKPRQRGKSRSRRVKKKAARPDEADADSDTEQDQIDEAAKDLEGSEGDVDGANDEDGGDPKSMAAMVDVDSVSEPVAAEEDEDGSRSDPLDEADPGEVDLEAAKHVEGKAEAPLVTRGPRDDDGERDEDDDRDGRHRDRRSRGRSRQRKSGDDNGHADNGENGDRVESVGAEDAMEEVPDRSARKPRKQYRIQEVIKRRQILLVQVVKEERGNKGAALTTYLSLAGRYSVLMPNTARGGGISRKITNVQDRKRLKEIAKGLEVPQGMGVILRTAGANRTKAEVKRDFEYLMRLWENVRNLTLASTAPCLVYEEGSLIKRSIRDLYNKDISEIIVAGEEGYKEAKGFMKMLMPSHAKVVQPYREIHPIFSRSGIEAQLDRMLQPQVTLKSGGYIIINQTEALVAIDVNSGRSTREHSIEDTALQTNLEAADEVARQLRLRDLAGLIVVDFIDMEEKRNNRSVEKRLKDALKNDRARIQVGRISHFGLLEMSRQRIRASVLESTTQTCEHCGGTGHVRSRSSVALHVIRSIEEYLLKSTTHDLVVRTSPEIALYLLNQKRDSIIEMERRFGVSITIEADVTIGSAHLAIDRGAAVESPVRIEDIVKVEAVADDEPDVEPESDADDEEESKARSNDDEGRRGKRKRRRRGGRDRDREPVESETGEASGLADAAAQDDGSGDSTGDGTGDSEKPRKRRRRGKRGGRRNSRAAEYDTSQNAEATEEHSGEPAQAPGDGGDTSRTPEAGDTAAAATSEADTVAENATSETEPAGGAPKKRRAPRRKKSDQSNDKTADVASSNDDAGSAKEPEPAAEHAASAVDAAAGGSNGEEAESTGAPRGGNRRKSGSSAPSEPVLSSNTSKKDEDSKEEQAPKKIGWWQRRSFF